MDRNKFCALGCITKHTGGVGSVFFPKLLLMIDFSG